VADGERSEKDLLVELDVDVKWIKVQLSNHLQHHKAMSYILLTFIGGLITALVIALTKS